MSEQAPAIEYGTKLGVVTVAALRRREQSALKRWGGLMLAPMIWIVPCVIVTVIASAVTGIAFTPAGWFFSPVVGLFVVFSIYRVMALRRRRNGEMVLGYLESAARLNFPLPPFLLAAAQSERGSRARQVMVLREELSYGTPVHVALSAATDLPESTVAVIAAHESIGQLPRGLTRVMEQREAAARKAGREDRAAYAFYQVYLVFFLLLLMTAYMIFVVPKFRDIFKDFKVELPWITRTLMGVGSFLYDDQWWWGLLLVLGMLAVIIVTMTVWMQRAFFPGWPLPRFWRGAQWLAWRVPFLRGMEQNRGMALVCELLAEATRAGLPLPEALDRAMILPINPGLEKKLLRWRDGMRGGKSPGEAAARAGMPAALVGFLTPAMGGAGGDEETGAAEMFEFMAQHYRQRFSRMVETVKAASEPMLVILLGAVVMFFVVSLMMPLATLIRATEYSVPGGTPWSPPGVSP